MKGVLKKEILDVTFNFENFNLLDKTSSSWAKAGYKKYPMLQNLVPRRPVPLPLSSLCATIACKSILCYKE